MISRKDLKDLLALERRGDGSILSVYLNIDQSQAVNLNRGFEAALKSLLQKAAKTAEYVSEQENFEAAAKRVTSFVCDYQPEAKSIVMFSDAASDRFWHRNLEIPLSNMIHWGVRPYIRPLLEARDEFERYGVILADRARARHFVVVMKTIEELQEALAEAEVRKFDASGTDQLRSQMSFQRKADEHARWHLKKVADQMARLSKKYSFDRLVLAGTQEVVSELRNLLPERLKKAVVGSIALPIDAGVAETLEETIGLHEKQQRVDEMRIVQNLLTSAAKNQLAVTGLASTLEALLEGRIRELVYSDSFVSRGGECRSCGTLFDVVPVLCPRCEGRVDKVDDLLEAVVFRVLREGGVVEQVRGDAARDFVDTSDGIGAYLRF